MDISDRLHLHLILFDFLQCLFNERMHALIVRMWSAPTNSTYGDRWISLTQHLLPLYWPLFLSSIIFIVPSLNVRSKFDKTFHCQLKAMPVDAGVSLVQQLDHRLLFYFDSRYVVCPMCGVAVYTLIVLSPIPVRLFRFSSTLARLHLILQNRMDW